MDMLFINSVEFIEGNDDPQIGQLILRKILRKKYDVDYINFDYLNTTGMIKFKSNFKDCIELFVNYIIDKTPKIVGFYTISDSFICTVYMARLLKQRKPDIKVIMGGPHATLTYYECLKNLEFVDVISIGEGEQTILPLVDALLNNKELLNVPGIAYRKDGKIIRNECLDLVPSERLGDYTEFDYSPYKIDNNTNISIEAGRGCPFYCDFCSTSIFWNRKFRIKPAKTLIWEMKQFYTQYGVHKFSLQHDMLTANKNYMMDFCNQLEDLGLDITWNCSARIDCIDYEMLEHMRKSGCVSIYLGIETGSNRMQQLEHKGLKLDNAMEKMQFMKEIGYNMMVSFIYGYPEETIDDIKQTLSMMDRLICSGIYNVQLHRYLVLPMTKDYEKVKEHLYLDQNQISELSTLYQYIFDDKEIKDYVTQHKEIFVQYYTFDNEVRKVYHGLDVLFQMWLTLFHSGFKWSAVELVKQLGFNDLFLFTKDIVQETFISEQEKGTNVNNYLDQSIQKRKQYAVALQILEAGKRLVDSELYQDIYNYESLVKKCKTGEMDRNAIYVFNFDVYNGCRTGIFNQKKTYIKFERKDNQYIISKVKVIKNKK